MKVNNKTLVLNCLMQGKTITQVEAIHQFKCYRLSSVIHSLCQDGYLISTKMQKNASNHGMHARYELIGVSQ